MRRALILCGWLALLLAALGTVAGLWVRAELSRPFKGFEGQALVFEIPAGEGGSSILHRLQASGVISSALLAKAYLVWVLGDPPLKAGEYRFREALTAPQVLDRLARGEVLSHELTLVEGLTLEETAELIAESGFSSRPELLREMGSGERIRDLDPLAPNLEGYLFPDTYAFARQVTAGQIVEALLVNFRQRFADQVRPLLGTDSPANAREIVTLASIVEKETGQDDERPVVAGVFANRLRRGMALYADPTIIYALKLRGEWDGNLRRRDLKLDSPYNTYLYPGLPPGPIASPGLRSLQAAAAPAEVPYLYFVSRNDGTHVFAATLAQHNRNVAKWQKLYWSERRQPQDSASGGE